MDVYPLGYCPCMGGLEEVMEIKLTNKQRMFCIEYMVDLNATQAAIRAGYSEHTAKDMGCENLAKPNIQEYIAILMKERTDAVLITVDDVIKDIIETRQDAKSKMKLSDRLRANELLGKYLAIWTENVNSKNEHSGIQTIYIDGEEKIKLESHISDIVDSNEDTAS